MTQQLNDRHKPHPAVINLPFNHIVTIVSRLTFLL